MEKDLSKMHSVSSKGRYRPKDYVSNLLFANCFVSYALRVKPKTAGDKGYEVIQEHKKAIQNRGAKLINIDEAGVLS